MKAISLIYRTLTMNEFKAINGLIQSQGGGSQTYIDFPKASVSDEQWKTFLGEPVETTEKGYKWKVKVNSLSLGKTQESIEISCRRDTTNSLRDQYHNRIKIWSSSCSPFPDGTQSYTEDNPIIVFIIKDEGNQFWAGWFYRNTCTPDWFMNIELASLFFDKAKGGAGYIYFSTPIPFDESIYSWPFSKTEQNANKVKPIVPDSIPDTFRPLLTAIRTKPFILLAGISGTGKSRIVRKLAQASVSEDLQKMYDPKSVECGFNRWQLHKPANFELIQVKPNWHNSLEVVGYKSNIGGAHYEFTPFVEFVARAWKHPETPFFLCLDEMNLAPVEQYFAEFLSAIESRSIENNEYETDPIIKPFESFDADNDTLSDRMIAHLLGKLDTQEKSNLADRFRTKGLTLPQNLIILGTVNMDETTFSFSRKVLDRAMSIVMDDVDYESYFNGSSENNVPEMDEGIKQLIINRNINGLEAKDNDADAVKNYLTSINAILDKTPFKLGYRAANEALLYVSAAHSINPESSTKDALDEFTLMKILSRIEGDKRSIDNLLENLKDVINSTDYPKSYEVLDSMSKTLNSKQFVSYWTK